MEGSVIFSQDDIQSELVEGLPAEEVHRRALEARRALGKAQKALTFWLMEVERRELYRHFGCSNVFHYAEARLQLAPHTIAEFRRTGRELERLPKLAEAVAKSEIAPSKAREISRVATSETEDFWVGVGASSTYREVERLVAVTPKGGLPGKDTGPSPARSSVQCAVSASGAATVPVQEGTAAGEAELASEAPLRYHHKLIVDLESDQVVLLDKAFEKARRESGARERSELLMHIARAFLEEDSRKGSGSPYRITLHHSPSDNLTWVEGNGGSQLVPASTLEEAMCDAEILDLTEDPRQADPAREMSSPVRDGLYSPDAHAPDADEPARDEGCCHGHREKDPARDERRGPRLRRTLPPTLRRKVLERDGCCCTVLGCRNRRHLQIHHIDPLSEGGADRASNLVTSCSRHHRMLHLNELSVKGSAPDALIWRDGKGRLLQRSG